MHGGSRNGSGRPKGGISFRTRAVLEAAASGGEMPIAYMLRVMRDENAPDARRDDMARAAAAYLHSKSSVVRYEETEDDTSTSEPQTPENGHDPQ